MMKMGRANKMQLCLFIFPKNRFCFHFATQAVAGLPLSSREERAERRVRSCPMLRQRKSRGQNIVAINNHLAQNGVETPAQLLGENGV
jgi:hypothetical protein